MPFDHQDRAAFVDHVRISVRGGRGGNGCVSFRREKYVERGGPDGASGGRGGEVFLKADPHKRSLLDLTYQAHYMAGDGAPGRGANKVGRGGEDLVVSVPVGTMVYRADQQRHRTPLADLRTGGQVYLAAKGGRGGRGNASFKTTTNTAPKISEKGEPGEAWALELELKVLADIGLIGFPNAGKSTLLSRLTSARPKIAAYPFTTLNPNLGVADWHSTRMVIADIPGLIEGAHAGKGLGHDFLRHIERTRLLLDVVDIIGDGRRDAIESIRIILEELKRFSPKLLKKPIVIVANKMDLTGADRALSELRKKWRKTRIFPISAVSGQGMDSLLAYAAEALQNTPVEEPAAPPSETLRFVVERDFEVEKLGDVFHVKGTKVEKLAAMTHFSQPEGFRRFQNILKKMGVEKELLRQGVQAGDPVRIGKTEFSYEP